MDADTLLFKKIIRSQNVSLSCIADVMKVICKGYLISKSVQGKKHGRVEVWILKQDNGEQLLVDIKQAAKWVFDRVIPNYHRTANFMFENAFDETTEMLMKPHHIVIGNKLLKVIERLDD
jgi:hypothetical protein